jgi:putative ABC transport system permease protein
LVPFSGDYDRVGISKILGRPERVGAASADGDRYVVSPAYFATMGIRLLRGRLLTTADRVDTPIICVVDEVFARHTFGSDDPIGQRMQIPGRKDYAEIVGVVTHVKTYGLDVESPGQIYISNEQYPWRYSSIVLRTVREPLLSMPAVVRAVHQLDPDQPVSNVAAMDRLMDELLRARRFTLTLLSAFALVAITLAAIGLYGVVAYGVTQRRREFGVRMALGAQRRQIARMILFEGGRIAVIGALLGAAGALAVSRFVSSLLFEVNARDATVFTVVALELVGVAMLACVVPAHRATTVDAAEVLRGD